MIKILNRIAWVASLSFGFVLTIFSGISLDLLDNRSSFDDDTLLFWVLLTLLFGLFFKKLFLSKSFISSLVGESIDEEQSQVSLGIKNIQKIAGRGNEESGEVLGKELVNGESEAKISGLSPDTVISAQAEKINSKKISELPDHLSISESNDDEIKKPIIEKKVDILERKAKEKKVDEPNFLQQFFSENALAKIGGILLFIGVLFLLQLVYTVIGPVGKLMIGFLIGLILFSVGVFLDNRGHKKEARIIMGTSILINYLVILSGRYLITESSDMGKTILNEGLTFFFLIINTIFAISVSMAYKSNALLFFAFVISYLNPFLVGAEEVYTPYTLLGYGLIVSFGSLAMSYFLLGKSKIQSLYLTHIAFIGGGILMLVAPFTTSLEWIVKLGALAVLSFISLLFLYKQKNYKVLPGYFIGIYLFFFILLQVGGVVLGGSFGGINIFWTYFLFIFILLGSSVYLFVITSLMSMFTLIFAPILIFLVLILSGMVAIDNVIWVLVLSMISYVGIFSMISTKLVDVMKYFLFGVLGVFVVIINIFLGNISGSLSFNEISLFHIIGIMVSTYIFYISAYYFSTKKGLESLYSLGTLFGILMVLPIISREGEFRVISVIGISGLILFNMLLPLLNKNLLKSNIQNLVFGVVLGALFTISQIYYFMFGEKGESQMTLGLMFLAVALMYFVISYLMYSMFVKSKKNENSSDVMDKNIFYTFAATSISIFSLAIAFVFADSPSIISIVWLFESSILFFFYRRSSNNKIYIFAFVMMIIGLSKILNYIFTIKTGDYSALIPVAFIFGTIVLSLKLLDTEERNVRLFHDLGHAFGIFMVALTFLQFIPDKHGFQFFGLALLSIALFFLYSRVYAARAKYILIFFLFIVMGAQIFALPYLFRDFNYYDMGEYKMLQYLSTIIFAAGLFIFNGLGRYYYKENKIEEKYFVAINVISVVYFFVISTQYIYYLIDENVFAVSIYWGVLAFGLLYKGIHSNIIKYRTLGLYVLTLTVGKIVLSDIWNGLDNSVMRVIALMLVGGILISVSTLYSKKYGNQIKGEFSLDNLLRRDQSSKEIIPVNENNL